MRLWKLPYQTVHQESMKQGISLSNINEINISTDTTKKVNLLNPTEIPSGKNRMSGQTFWAEYQEVREKPVDQEKSDEGKIIQILS